MTVKVDNGLLEQIRKQVHKLEVMLNTDIPGTPKMSLRAGAQGGGVGGRVMYVALPGTGSKSKNALSPRAKQVLGQINRQRRATAAALQEALEVNRNVIAGAVHELKQAGLVGTEALAAAGAGRMTEAAAEPRPRQRKANGGRKASTRK